MKNVLVLGANGFIGSHLVRTLLSENKVVGYDALGTTDIFQSPNYTHIAGNFCCEQEFSRILSKYHISIVYHMICTTIPASGTEHVEREIQQNIIPTVRLLESCVQCGVERFIFTSSGGTVYGEGKESVSHIESEPLQPICSYGVQKMTIEGYMRLYEHMHGIRTIAMRLSNPYGFCIQSGRKQGIIPIFLQKIMQNEPVTVFGDTTRDYLYIDDAISALFKVLTYNGKEHVFNVGSGIGTELNRLIKLIECVTKQEFSAIGWREIRSCDVDKNVLNVSMTKKELEWYPKMSLEDGIACTFQKMKQSDVTK